MSETTIHLTENVLPHVPYRQWVVTFPHSLRFWLATSRELTGIVHDIVTRMITLYYQSKAEERDIENAVPGGVTFIQRFGSALNLNVHIHAVFIDGVYVMTDGRPVFYHLPGPTDSEVGQVVEAIATSAIAALRKNGYLSEEGTPVDRPDAVDKVFAESEQLTATAHASNQMRIAFGERAGKSVRRLGQQVHRVGNGCGYEEEQAFIKGPQCASTNGFNVHANRFIGQQERSKLKDLIDYAGRPAFSHERLSLRDPTRPVGDLVYSLKSPWSDGTTSIILSPAELIEKLVALVPPPKMHMTRHVGVLSSANKWRSKIVLKPHVKKGFVAPVDGVGDPVRLSWSMLLKKVFQIDVTRCVVCGGRIYPYACKAVTVPEIITSILRAMGMKDHPPPIKPARYLVRQLDFDQRVAGCDE
jgi:hypothetical protein